VEWWPLRYASVVRGEHRSLERVAPFQLVLGAPFQLVQLGGVPHEGSVGRESSRRGMQPAGATHIKML
jgi:hypothetical protein